MNHSKRLLTGSSRRITKHFLNSFTWGKKNSGLLTPKWNTHRGRLTRKRKNISVDFLRVKSSIKDYNLW